MSDFDMNPIYLVANGDFRLAVNQACWQAQSELEQKIITAVKTLGGAVQRAHPYNAAQQHGFIDSQKYGMEIFKTIPPDAPVIVAIAAEQHSQHVLAGLMAHAGPLLIVAHWNGRQRGIGGMLNLNAALAKAGVAYSALWSENFDDPAFLGGLVRWLKKGSVKRDLSHVRKYDKADAPGDAARVGKAFAKTLRAAQAIVGLCGEGGLGIDNARIPDELLAGAGVFQEHLSPTALVAKMRSVTDDEARAVLDWFNARGMQFQFGAVEATELTPAQVLNQCKMYIAATRLADESGCAALGIQYQPGLDALVCASDLVEGALNNVERPPVWSDGRELYPGDALPHFNQADQCAGLDSLVTYRLWRELGYAPETTLHEIRWGRQYTDENLDAFVWLWQIPGAVPPAHFANGWRDARGERQPPLYFPLGGSTIKGVSKPGWIVWSRVFVAEGKLHFDTGIAQAVELPLAETQERWQLVTPQWPLMHVVLQGISRDQMLARHPSNRIQVAYTPDKASAVYGMYAKAAAMKELGLKAHICGEANA